MDNLQVHKTKRVRELIEGRGCQLVFLPSYSPEFNPIEEAFRGGEDVAEESEGQELGGVSRSHRCSPVCGEQARHSRFLRPLRIPNAAGAVTMKTALSGDFRFLAFEQAKTSGDVACGRSL